MRTVIRSSFFWRFAGGFALGTLGVLTLQPGNTAQRLATHGEATVHTSR